MCGLVGHIAYEVPVRAEAVEQALNLMHHRGPDDSGVVSFNNAILGHRRLSIIDTAGSPQPWQSEDGRYTIVFNGEIYNYLELRKQLLEKRGRFRTKGDTEVLLQAYIKYGEECLHLLNGMFAFAIWDEREKILFAARDRMGEKPLFYAHNGREFIFASELQVIPCFKNIDLSLNPEALNRYFANQFISGPGTIYRHIHELPPAHSLIYKYNSLSIKRYWALPHPEPVNRKLDDLTEELFFLLSNSVKLRLRSDVPLGVFLSGGVDSATIVAFMRQHVADVKSFTIRFKQSTYDESMEAQVSSSLLGTQHYESTVTPNLAEDLPHIVSAVGQPFGDTSIVPTWYLCRATRQKVTVALSGDGADEILGGYKRYQASKILEKTGWFPYGLLERFIRFWPDNTEYYGKSWSKKIRLFLQFRERQKQSPVDLTPQVFLKQDREQLFNQEYWHELHRNDIADFHLEELSPTERMLYVDSMRYLPDDILVKVDRMSMAHSLEVRTPFLDHHLVEFCSKLPIQYKIQYREQKYLLKQTVQKFLPSEIVKRPKHGFASPVGDILKNNLKEYFQEIVLDDSEVNYFNRKEINRLWSDHQAGKIDNGMKLWTILVFYCWHRQALLS